jgi:hypothetical protein
MRLLIAIISFNLLVLDYSFGVRLCGNSLIDIVMIIPDNGRPDDSLEAR